MYGLRIEGLGDPSSVLAPVPGSWPLLAVEQVRPDGRRRPADREPGLMHFDPERAEAWLDDETRIELDRATLRARFLTRSDVDDEALAHPYLGLPAAVANHWLGRPVLHGGAFLGPHGGAVGLLGDREAGKSSSLGWLHEAGASVISDDLLVLEGATVFAGPRSIDLRADAGELLGGIELGTVGGRTRRRVRSVEVAPVHDLDALVHLAWGDALSVEPVPLADRLGALADHLVFGAAAAPVALLDLAAVPTWRLTRPVRLDRIADGLEALLAQLG
jgi:hypothetical protein